MSGVVIRALVVLVVTLVGWRAVYHHIRVERVKVVQATVEIEGRAHFELGESLGSRPPLAVIARASAPNAAGSMLSISIDGSLVCVRPLAATTTRVDCTWAPRPGDSAEGRHTIAVEGPRSWMLASLEIATHFGQSDGAATAYITPLTASAASPLSGFWVLVAALIVTACLTLQNSPSAPSLLWALSAVAGILGLLILAAPLITSYRVMVSAGTFIRWCVLLVSPTLWLFLTREGGWGKLAAPRSARTYGVVTVAVIAGAVAASFISIQATQWKGNVSGLLLISRDRFDHNPIVTDRKAITESLVLLDNSGYDGQFMYFQAFDPLMTGGRSKRFVYHQAVDIAPYRFGRMGFSALTRLVTAGRPTAFPRALVGLVWLGVASCCLICAAFAQRAGRHPMLGLLPLAVPGVWLSMQTALPEPLAAATLLAGLFFVDQRRVVPAAVLFAVSLLVRETGLIAVAVVAAAWLMRGARKDAVVLLVIAVLPLAVWRLYIGFMFWDVWGWSAFAYVPPTSRLFVGIVTLWSHIWHGTYFAGLPDFSRAGMTLPLVLIAATAVAITAFAQTGHYAFGAAVIYGMSALTLDYNSVWLNVGNAERTSYEVFMLIAVGTLSVVALTRRMKYCLWGFWCLSALYVLFARVDAESVRACLATVPFA